MKSFIYFKVLIFIFILNVVLGCKHENSERMEKPVILKKTDTNKLGIRFYKNDSGSFYFLINANKRDSLTGSDTTYHRNIFLIQPRRYQ
jgi:hypothetical protein